MPEFRTMITLVGQQKIAVAIAAQTPLTLTQMAVGDSNGVGYDPIEAQDELVNEKYRNEVDSVEVLTGGVIVCQMTIPITEGGWHIREAGVFDEDGDMIAVIRIADRYKPLPSSGQADDLTIVLKLDVGNVGAVTWAIDPQKKIHHGRLLRTFFQVVEAADVAAPPVDAEPGETYVIPEGAAGAWATFAHRLAQWTGLAWSIVDPPHGHIVRVGDSRTYLQRTAQGWQPWLFIADDMTLTIGDGGDFADIGAAAGWLSSRIIIDGARVTLAFLAGEHVFEEDFIWDYLYGHAVRIVGAAMLGDDPVLGDFAVTDFGSGARAANAATNVAMLRGKYASEIQMTNGARFIVRGALGLIDDLLITGDGTPGAYGLWFDRAIADIGTVSVHGTGDDGVYAVASTLGILSVLSASGGAADGIEFEATTVSRSRASSAAPGGALLAFGNAGHGIDIQSGTFLRMQSAGARGNGANGLLVPYASDCWLQSGGTYTNNGGNGAMVTDGSWLRAPGGVFNNNAGAGVRVDGAFANITDGAATSAGSHAVHATNGATVIATNVTGTNAGGYGMLATGGSYIDNVGGSTGGAAIAASSPAFNTVGNDRSYIKR